MENKSTNAPKVSDSQFQSIAAVALNYYQQGKLKEAETIFGGLQLINPKLYYTYAGLGAVALAKQPMDLNSAYMNLSKAAELNPNDASVQANLGEVLLRQGKLEDAKPHFEKAFQLDPGHNDPGANRARAIVGGLNVIATQALSQIQSQPKQVAKAS